MLMKRRILNRIKGLYKQANNDVENVKIYKYPNLTKEEIDEKIKELFKESETDSEDDRLSLNLNHLNLSLKMNQKMKDESSDKCSPTIFTEENKKEILEDGFVNEFADEDDELKKK